MPRPAKNNCDYFPHDADMRNHRKVKAIRTKFGISGYAIWVMLLEYLTDRDGNTFSYSDVEFELIAGDFGVSATEIRSVVDYCVTLGMLNLQDGLIRSMSLDDRLAPVYDKRRSAKEKSNFQQRVSGKFANTITDTSGVSDTEIPQKKRKEIRVNEIKGNNNQYITICDERFFDPYPLLEYYEAALNGRQKEHNTRNWKDVVPEWFAQVIHHDFNDQKHVFNSFSKYLITNCRLNGFKKPTAQTIDMNDL